MNNLLHSLVNRPWLLRAGVLALVLGLHAGVVLALQQPVELQPPGGEYTAVELHFEQPDKASLVEISPHLSESTTTAPQSTPELEPELGPQPETESEPEPSPERESRPEPAPKPTPTSKPTPKSKPKAASANESLAEPMAALRQPQAVPVLQDAALVQVSELQYVSAPPRPQYPRGAQRLGHQGLVVVRLTIARTGTVESMRVTQSSGHEMLDEAALRSVRNVRFQPYVVHGVARRAMADIPFDFVLRR